MPPGSAGGAGQCPLGALSLEAVGAFTHRSQKSLCFCPPMFAAAGEGIGVAEGPERGGQIPLLWRVGLQQQDWQSAEEISTSGNHVQDHPLSILVSEVN